MDRVARLSILLFAVGLAGCPGPDEAPAHDMPPTTTEAGGATGSAMMDDMRAHVGRMDGIATDSLQTMLPAHRQSVGNMLAQMGADMRSMNMPADASWTALVDSIRADVIRMPELSGTELQVSMPDHLGRVSRLLESHAVMMGRMRM
jgi:hypothetical protein